MKIGKLSRVRTQHAAFNPSWTAQPPDCLASDPRFGMILHSVACDDLGQPLYDTPLWLERTGAIAVPVDQDDRIVMLLNFRVAPCNPDQLGRFPLDNLERCGRLSLELPRGFPEPGESPDVTALREVEEETGFMASEATFLGATNTNTTYYPFSNRVYLVRVDSLGARSPQAMDNERIDAVLLMTRQEVLQRIVGGEIFCGMTKSALMSYFAVCELNASTEEQTIPSSAGTRHG